MTDQQGDVAPRGEIMIVDDTATNLQVLAAILENENYTVRPALNGQLALQAISVAVPDLILLDVRMPNMTGFEMCDTIKKDPRYAHVPIIFVSASTDTADKLEAFRAGGVDYITKPYQAEEVLVRVNLHLRLTTLTASLRQANADLNAAVDRITDTQAQLVESEKMAALGSLVAGIAHEINTPLGIAITAVSTLQSEIASIGPETTDLRPKPDYADVVQVAGDSADLALSNLERAADIVDRFKRIAVDRSLTETRAVELVPYIEEAIRTLTPVLKPGHHYVTVTGERSLVIETDPGAFSIIISNFVMNSIQHGYLGKEKGHIQIDVADAGTDIVVTYADDGAGIPTDRLRRVFEPFYTTGRGRGRTGLGLHVVYNVVTQVLQGSVQAKSPASHGAEFTVTIPRKVRS